MPSISAPGLFRAPINDHLWVKIVCIHVHIYPWEFGLQWQVGPHLCSPIRPLSIRASLSVLAVLALRYTVIVPARKVGLPSGTRREWVTTDSPPSEHRHAPPTAPHLLPPKRLPKFPAKGSGGTMAMVWLRSRAMGHNGAPLAPFDESSVRGYVSVWAPWRKVGGVGGRR